MDNIPNKSSENGVKETRNVDILNGLLVRSKSELNNSANNHFAILLMLLS